LRTDDLKLSANDVQVGGEHYKGKAIQPWDYIVSNELGYLEGNIVKYVSRWKQKGGIADLQKAQHYLAKLIEVSVQQSPSSTISGHPAPLDNVASVTPYVDGVPR
jgi:hypothetical protein